MLSYSLNHDVSRIRQRTINFIDLLLWCGSIFYSFSNLRQKSGSFFLKIYEFKAMKFPLHTALEASHKISGEDFHSRSVQSIS